MSYLYLIIGIIVGFLVVHIFSGKKEGEIGLFILLLKTEHHTYHLHHWIVALLVLVTLYLLKIDNTIVYGLLIGALIQGLTYKDFHKIVVKQKRKKK